MDKEIRIVIPTYNEKGNLKELIPKIFEVSEENSFDLDVLVVDDNSPDGTAEFVENMSEEYPVKVLKREEKSGLGSAYIRGFKESLKEGKDIIFEMDADLSHDPEYLPEFVEKIRKGYNLVLGEREDVEGWGWYRKSVSWGGNLTGRILAGINVNDLTTGYRAYKREVLESMDLESIESDGYAFQLEMLAKPLAKDFKIGSVPIIFYDREEGKSKLSKSNIMEFFILAIKIRLNSIS